MFNWLKTKPIDRNDDIERLEQRIRDIRGRIWEAQNPQKPVLPTPRMDETKEIERLRIKSADLRRSLTQGPAVSKESQIKSEITEAERLKAKLLGKT
jgi:hypothetical protein